MTIANCSFKLCIMDIQNRWQLCFMTDCIYHAKYIGNTTILFLYVHFVSRVCGWQTCDIHACMYT